LLELTTMFYVPGYSLLQFFNCVYQGGNVFSFVHLLAELSKTFSINVHETL